MPQRVYGNSAGIRPSDDAIFLRDAAEAPEALGRLGTKTFVPVRVGRRKVPGHLIYFNRELAAHLGYTELLKNYRRREALLRAAFDFDADLSLCTPGTETSLWTDFQSDPSGLALSGNTGSGRAAYVGRRFNRKGLGRTPHARAGLTELHGTGRLPFFSAVWEILFSNTLATNFETGAPPVLSAFVLDTQFPAPGGAPGALWRAATIERLDEGRLDRPTHLFYSGQPVDLRHTAERFGIQEGEKFIERLLHGAWSTGNISTEGHTLDLETACCVPVRTPQRTLVGIFLPNYFGYEGIGQLRVLEYMAQDTRVNAAGHSYDSLAAVFSAARTAQIRKRLPQLLGFESAPESEALRWLADTFERLAGKMFPYLPALNGREPDAPASHLFDFSALFRRYAAARARLPTKRARAEYAIQCLRNPFVSFTVTPDAGVSEEVIARFETDCFVTGQAQYLDLKNEAREFIRRLELFFCEQEKTQPASFARAYTVNEDRQYLTAAFGHRTVAAILDGYERGTLSRRLLGRFIELLVHACDRRLRPDKQGRWPVDLHIYREGFVRRLLHADGRYQIQLGLFKEQIPPAWVKGEWEIKVGARRHPLAFHSKSRLEQRWVSPVLKDDKILQLRQSILLFTGGRAVRLTEPSGEIPRTPFSLNVD